MLKRPSELISQSNFKRFFTAFDTYRSLQSFCNYRESEVWSLESGVKDTLHLTPDFRLQTVFDGDKSY
ncbi:MAG: hypothetical protein QOJ02_772 [Acidobacteriota bacterium]|jgi:hypothetical protein|nr:hypothetical protein [Acidobacteriota bacterium]